MMTKAERKELAMRIRLGEVTNPPPNGDIFTVLGLPRWLSYSKTRTNDRYALGVLVTTHNALDVEMWENGKVMDAWDPIPDRILDYLEKD